MGIWKVEALPDSDATVRVLQAPRGSCSEELRGIRIYLSTPRLRGLLALNLSVAAASAMVIVNTVKIRLVFDRLDAGLGAGLYFTKWGHLRLANRDARVVLSIGRGNSEVAEVHMAISLGPQADAARYRLRQRVFKIALAVEIALDLGPTDANLEFVPLFRRGRRVAHPFNRGALALLKTSTAPNCFRGSWRGS